MLESKLIIDVPEFIGWVIFIAIYLVVWDAGIAHLLRLASQINSNTSQSNPVRRSSLFVLGSYAICRTTLSLVLSLLLLLCLERAYKVMKTHMIQFDDPQALLVRNRLGDVIGTIGRQTTLTWWLQWFNEDSLYRPMKPTLLPFHASVFVSAVLIATVFAVVYPSPKDLESKDVMKSTFVRQALCMSSTGLIAYVIMMLACSFSTQS